ncbi:hypothetical protein ACFPMF_05530 [Larkinella bovis]|uniref:DUF1080 domain-containing protein n=1 Tax=Larkinella bovis TaxID=683041 RepID=A0ABW0IBQ4_9BACT
MNVLKKRTVLVMTVLSLLTIHVASAQKTRTFNLARLAQQNGLRLENRKLQTLIDGGVRLTDAGKSGAGVAWVENLTFSEGAIEVDIRGKDAFQQSFVGVAFYGSGGQTYDAIYFRPFNFRAEEPVRRRHAVQYISMPDYDWPRLRKDFPDQYENAINPQLDPTGWFHVRIVVDKELIQVFVDHNLSPSLRVKKLTGRQTGQVGLWVGTGSDGDFANLKITTR